MNPFLPQQNFYSQQLRALALVEVVGEIHLPAGRRNVLIVGAGIAGLTLAAAFATIGASVRLIETRDRWFERYRGAVHRELHPNIIFWPMQDPVPATALPFLNWAQASAREVVGELHTEWNESFGKKVKLVPGEVTAVREVSNGIELDLKGADQPLTGDLCVFATGFKNERSFGTLKSPGYWSPSAVADEDNTVLVSGSGDGGLIDVLSPILGTEVTRAAHLLAISLNDSSLKEDILKIEQDRFARRIPGSRDSADGCSFYTKVTVPPDAASKIEELCQSQQRLSRRSVTFLYNSTSPYSYTAAPINKLLLAHFSAAPRPRVTSVKGELNDAGGKHRMECGDGTRHELDPPSAFEKIMVRHGAEPGVCGVLEPEHVAALEQQADRYNEAAMVDGYSREMFGWHENRMGKSGVTGIAMPKSVRRALSHIGRAYGIDITKIGPIGVDCLRGTRPIEVELPAADRRKAEELRLFPLKIGPAIVTLGTVSARRDAPYDE